MKDNNNIIDSMRRQAGLIDEAVNNDQTGERGRAATEGHPDVADCPKARQRENAGVNSKQLSARQTIGIVILVLFVYWTAEHWLDRLFWIFAWPFAGGMHFGLSLVSFVAGVFCAALAAASFLAAVLVVRWLRRVKH